MLKKSILLASVVSLLVSAPVQGAGPVGHFLLGKQLISNIQGGRYEVDPELKYILKHEDARKAFVGGCVGPDLAERATHYRNTADLAAAMLKDARQHYRAAASAKDSEAFVKARQELAFAYGWYSHCAVDLNVHPKVNAVVGDTFRYNNYLNQLQHGVQESELTAYLKSVVTPSKYEISVPWEFLSKHVGSSVKQLQDANKTLTFKSFGELGWGKNASVTEKVKMKWQGVVNQSLRDSQTFLKNPSAMGNWDLDCGKISTADFEALRKLVKEANGGKLPANWGKSYLTWYSSLRGLPKAQQLASLKILIAGGALPVLPSVSKPEAAPATIPSYVWVLAGKKEFNCLEASYSDIGTDGNYTMKWESSGCYAQGCPGETLSVRYTCSKPPDIIKPGEKIKLNISGTIVKNTMQHYGCNTSMDVFFDRVDIEPGAYGGGPGLGGIKLGGKDSASPPPQVIEGAPGKSYEGDGKVALIVALYNGRNAGTKYIYEWKPNRQ